MSTQTLYEQYPQAVEWILKLLRNSTPPSQLAAEVDPIKEQIRGYLGAQVGLNSLFSQPPATTPQHSGIWNRLLRLSPLFATLQPLAPPVVNKPGSMRRQRSVVSVKSRWS
jgi:hypothetical protein